jgi:dolichol-phosphate mannosyltransferase
MLSVIIPMKDEPAPERILGEVHEVMTDLPDTYEVIVVMGDKERLFTAVPVFAHQRVVKTYADALERSVLNGFSQAEGNRIIVMDADGSHPPAMLLSLYRELDGVEMVVGSRFVEGAEFTGSLYRKLVTGVTRFVAYQAGSRLSDPMSGFFGIRREVLDRCVFRPLTWKPCLEVELRAHPSVKEVPIRFVERRVGRSKTSLRVGLKILWELWWEGWEN